MDLVYTILRFDWDPAKAVANLAKHGVGFEEAASVFSDDSGLDVEDLAHSVDELRHLRLGSSSKGRVLVIAYTTRRNVDEEVTRIISARLASRRERWRYGSSED